MRRLGIPLAAVLLPIFMVAQPPAPPSAARTIGSEKAIPVHLNDGDEFRIPLLELNAFGKKLFMANWTDQDGGGRPLMKGTGKQLSDASSPLVGLRSFNRISGPDANSCYGCHNQPYGIPGGHGDFATNVFVQAQRFDFVTFDPKDTRATRGAVDENLKPVTLPGVGDLRSSTSMFGAGYLEMLAREITEDLQSIRSTVAVGGPKKHLVSKGISFGWISRNKDATWNVSEVEGLPRASLLCPTPLDPPSLIIRPWHQAGNVVSIREFTNNALVQHHGIQSTERFGIDSDPDGDGVTNEMTRADVTALTVFQAAMAVPGRVIPNDPEIAKAIADGEKVFAEIGCASCHIPSLRLEKQSWRFTEPNPFNPATNLRRGETKDVSFDLNDPSLPLPRLAPANGQDWVDVPAFTDFKLHDITDAKDPSDAEPLDMNQNVWSNKFSAGNRRFLTKRLWGVGNQPPYFHHGLFTTMRQAVLAHSGEALGSRRRFECLPEYRQDALIEFLKSLQVLPPGTKDLVVVENFRGKGTTGTGENRP
jgi:hypothetical protein